MKVFALLTSQVPALPSSPDSILGDSAGQSLTQIGESVTRTGRLILQGDWSAAVMGMWEGSIDWILARVPNVLSAVFVGVVFFVLFRLLYRVTSRVLRQSVHVDRGLENLLLKLLTVAGIAFILILVFSQLGFNVTAMVAGLGIAGLALGFAAQDTLANFIAGVTILLDRPFRVGDWIEVDTIYGQVRELTLRSTRIQTLGNRMLVVPNTTMINHLLTNYSADGSVVGLRVDVPFGIAYKERPAEARAVVLPLVEGDDRILPSPPPDVVVKELADSSVNMALRFWIRDPGNEYTTRFAYTEKIREALREANIEIPFPHLQLFVDEAKGLTAEEVPPIKVAGSIRPVDDATEPVRDAGRTRPDARPTDREE